MFDSLLHCENCGGELSSADSVCTKCEASLPRANAVVPEGKYKCPICGQFFRRPISSAVAPNAKWYVPDSYKPKCPHCFGNLRDRRYPRLPVSLVALLIGGALLAQWWLTGLRAKAALAVLLVIFMGAHLFIREWGVPSQDRFARDDA